MNNFINMMATYQRIAEIPFDAERKCMTTIHQFDNSFLVITKGASEAISTMLKDKDEGHYLLELSEKWAMEGLRVLAFAYKIIDKFPNTY